MTLPENAHGDFFVWVCLAYHFLTGFHIYFCLSSTSSKIYWKIRFRHSAPRLAETTQVQSLYEPLLSSGVVIYHCFKMIRATEEKYSIPELAAWAQKPSQGLGPDALLSGSFDVAWCYWWFMRIIQESRCVFECYNHFWNSWSSLRMIQVERKGS